VKLSKLVATAAFGVAATAGLALAQGLPEGRVYTFHSARQGGCPALDWHVVASGNGALDGMIAWNDMKQMAHATGSVNMQSRTFQMTAKEVGGRGRTAMVSGTVRQDGYLVANIKGPDVNCQNITVPWFQPPPPSGGG
jgi:hypothetical protein